LPHGGSGTGGAGEKDESGAAASTVAWRRAAAWRGGGRGGVEKGVEEKGPAAAILAAARTSGGCSGSGEGRGAWEGAAAAGVLGSARVAPEDDAGISHFQTRVSIFYRCYWCYSKPLAANCRDYEVPPSKPVCIM